MSPPSPKKADSRVEDVTIKAGARRMVDVCARFYPGTMTKRQIASAAKMKVTGGTFATYWSTVVRAGLIKEAEHGRWQATVDGLNLCGGAPGVKSLHSLDDRIEFWNQRLKAGARRILATVRDTAPISRAALAGEVYMAPTGGTFATYLGTLTSNHLIDKNTDGAYVLHRDLVSGGQQ